MKYWKLVFALGTLAFLASACEGSDEKCGDRYCYANETCINDKCVVTTNVSLCDGKTCPQGQTCNPDTGECQPTTTDLCKGKTCPTGTCNPLTGNCEGGQTNLCLNKTCKPGQTCNSQNGECEGEINLCINKNCPANQHCNKINGECEGGTDLCANKTCPQGQVCNSSNGECEGSIDLCANKTCPTNQHCNQANGECEGNVDLCANKTCPANQECNPANGECEGEIDLCANKTCPSNQECNPANGECEPITVDLCEGKPPCPYGQCNPATGHCEGACETACESWQYCALGSGTCKNDTGRCTTSADCANATDTCSTEHYCVATCDGENVNNIVLNWSFEDWYDSTHPMFWNLEGVSGATMSKSENATHCNSAVELTNTSTSSNARLVSDYIELPEITHLQNDKYTCTVKVAGTGTFFMRARTKKSNGEESFIPQNVTNKTIEDSSYRTESITLSIAPDIVAVQVMIGFQKTQSGSLIIDEFSCTRDHSVCDDIVCEDWQICTTANNGKCYPRDGFCDENRGCNTSTETCNTTTHQCEHKEGGCLRHEDCPNTQKCDLSSHTCVAGDRCDGVTCDEWKECSAVSGKCVLKEGRCNRSMDCNQRDYPACKSSTHECVGVDDPVNIVPNGGFETWEEVQFYESEDFPESVPKYNLPVKWYGINFSVGATNYASEIDPNKIHPYTSNTHSGSKALQIEFTDTVADRFTSEGFDVPSGMYDCSFWVRGKGEVRFRSYSSRGEAPYTDFVSYDTNEWVRVPFSIKSASSAMRLVFYVSNTDASRDHIQIDDVVCTKYTY